MNSTDNQIVLNETTRATATIEFYPNAPKIQYGTLIFNGENVTIFKSFNVINNGVEHNYTIMKNGRINRLKSHQINGFIKTNDNSVYGIYDLSYVVRMNFDGVITDSIHIKNINDNDCRIIKTDGVNIYAFFEDETGCVVKKIDHELKTLTVLETPFSDDWIKANIRNSLNVVGDEIFSLVRVYKHNNILFKCIEIFGKGPTYVITQYQDGDEIKFFGAKHILCVMNLNYAILVNDSHILLIDIGYGHGLVHGRVVHRVEKLCNVEYLSIVGPNDFNIWENISCHIKNPVV